MKIRKGHLENMTCKIRSRASILIGVLLVVAIVAAWLSSCSRAKHPDDPAQGVPGLVDYILTQGVLRAGYGVYPPYTEEDPNTKKVSGFSVDLIERIASELGCRVEWHRVNWDTMSADLKRGTYDVVADPIFQTVPRAPEFAFSDPYAYFADGIGVVRKGDHRFKQLDDMDKPGLTISVGQGQATEAFLQARFSQAKIEPVPATTDNMQIFAPLLAGRADAAVADELNAEKFASEHPSQVELLWVDSPPTSMPAGFALRPADLRGVAFLNVCLRNLKAVGFLDALARKYKVKLGDQQRH